MTAAATAASMLCQAGMVEVHQRARAIWFDARAAAIVDRPDLAGALHPRSVLGTLGLHSASLTTADRRFLVARRGANHVTFTVLRRTSEGQTRHLLVSLCRAAGSSGRWIGAIADRTTETRHHAEVTATLKTVPSAMIVIDDSGAIRAFSATAERMFGLTSKQVLGAKVGILAPRHAHGDAASREGLVALLLSGAPRTLGKSCHVHALRSDGTGFPAEVWVGDVTVEGERLTTAFVRDQTLRFETEATLQKLQHDLVHASRVSAMGELSLALAHELNQPLAALVNHLSVAEHHLAAIEAPSATAAAESVGRACRQALRTGEIVKRLRTFVQRGEGEPTAEPVDRIVGEAVSLLSTLAQQRGIQLQIRLPGGHARVFADRVHIQQVLVNLMRNAIEALHRSDQQERLLYISVQRNAGDLQFSVEDNGPGIPGDVEPALFSRFSTSTTGEGMGVGLSISRRIIEAHGAELRYCRGSLGGARFTFALPEHRERQHG